jgi:hypothetical protein
MFPDSPLLPFAASRKVERIHSERVCLRAFAAFKNSFTSSSLRRIGTILALTCPFGSGGRPRPRFFSAFSLLICFAVVLNDSRSHKPILRMRFNHPSKWLYRNTNNSPPQVLYVLRKLTPWITKSLSKRDQDGNGLRHKG